jgi:hypothetical protein
MNFSATHLKRYRQIAGIMWKYGRSDVVKQMSAHEAFEPDKPVEATTDAAPEQLADDAPISSRSPTGWPWPASRIR